MGPKIDRQKQKIVLIAILISGSCFLTYYYHIFLQVHTVLAHFFYIPIILASLWWKRKGLAIAIFLALFLIFGHYLFGDDVINSDDYVRATMFVVIGCVVALLSERLAKNVSAVRGSEAQKKAILDASIDVIRLVDKDMKIIWANKTTTTELKATPEQLVGSFCYEAVAGRDTPCHGCPTKKALKSGKIERTLMHQKELKGIKEKTYWDDYAVPIRNESGDIVNLIQISRNITDHMQAENEKRNLETQLQKAQKMEAIATLAGGVAHDFNNILMAIQGRTSIMLMDMDSSHPDFEHLTRIDGQIESAANLTKQLLGFARGGKYEVRPTDLNELVKSHNRMFGRTKKEITIRGKYEKDLWIVTADQGQIDQVLMNLYVNAWQAMPGGGNINVQTENVLIDENYDKMYQIKPGRYVKISVTDNGVGMDKSVQKRIFDPFFTTKEMGSGTGLGLASAYGIIKNHGGFINVYSEQGHGSTFNIYLPATDAEGMAQRAEYKGKDKIIRGKETVLFVDDEDMIIEVVGEMLEQLGYKILTAESGTEAIKTYKKNKEQIDIVILDMVMPDMNGGEIYDKLKQINPDIKVLLASGYSLDGAATEILDRGCSGFIQKPVKTSALSQKLREILDS